MGFEFREAQDSVRAFWQERGIYAKAKAQGKGKPSFYFLDGPPYTSGKVHIGTAWNKTLKDLVLRYRRMRGFDVWDRAGYDMHGLPTEHATEKKLGIAGRQQIEAFGKERFIEECRALCTSNMHEMNKAFKDLAVWMDFDNPYQTIDKRYMEGEWWLLKRAHERGRLYEGERSMTWDAHAATALAKHELYYQKVTDTTVYVRFKVKGEDDAYFLIWTTTPWTIPFDLAIMANPELSYCKVRVSVEGEEQSWYLAKDLLEDLLERKLKIPYAVEEEILGKDLEGREYEHFFADDVPQLAAIKAKSHKVHTVLMSAEHVDTSAGTGLVHCAPGCGPEDFEVGHRNGIRPFSTVDEHGYVRDLGPFTGIRAREEDARFIELIDRAGALVLTHKYAHEYPYGERSKQPVIFRVTKQWFLKVEDIKDELIRENDGIKWVPDAAYNAFNSWLENLRDNSISRQRYWGTPLPIWRNVKDPSDYIVVGNAKELKELAQLEEEPDDLHIPTVDKIIIRKDCKEYHRVPDVLDVWVDAGTASWNCIGYPGDKGAEERFKELYPADFILEGKDQIRGWFNLLHIASMVAMGRPSFKACYMHGFVNDAQGRKMSKSVGNYIVPAEVTEKYGVDATRIYMIGAANPGFDMNYNFEDLEAKFKTLLVFWNMHQYLLDLCEGADVTPLPIADEIAQGALGIEERYALSRLQSCIREMTDALDEYRLNEAPGIVEAFLLDLSRTYIQLTREKASAGSDDEKRQVASVLAHTLLEGMTLLAPVAPYFAEKVHMRLRERFPQLCAHESVHLRPWPQGDDALADALLEQDMVLAKEAIAAILEARDRAQLGVRWPVREVRAQAKAKDGEEALARMEALILYQVNAKALSFEPVEQVIALAPNFKTIGKEFGQATGDVVALIKRHEQELARMVREGKDELDLTGRTIKPEHLEISRSAKAPWQMGTGSGVTVYLDTTRTPELEREGFAREIVRRVQQLRKEAGLVKKDRIALELACEGMLREAVQEHRDDLMAKVGADALEIVTALSSCVDAKADAKIKGLALGAGLRRA